jgi:Zn-dependent protease with chaperone function
VTTPGDGGGSARIRTTPSLPTIPAQVRPAVTAVPAASRSDGRRADAACPQCETPLAGDHGYVRWCPACEWNIDGGVNAAQDSASRFEALYRRVSTRSARQLMTEVCSADGLRPRRDGAAWLAIALAVPVHLLCLALVGGAAWLALGLRSPLAYVGAVIMLGAAFLGRPRLERPAADGIHLHRTDAPVLFSVCDRISATTGAPQVAVITVVEDFNAFSARVGLRRRPNVTIGARWWAAVGHDSRLATLGHEFGHFSNGDWTHQFVVSSALNTLEEWYHAFGDGLAAGGLVGLVESAVGRVVRFVTGNWFWLIYVSLARVGQRAEYLADAMAATVAGTDAEIRAEQDMLGAGSVDVSIATSVAATLRTHPRHVPDDQLSVWATVAERAARTPASELERRLRASKRSQTRVDDSHPPTWMRIEAVRSRPTQDAAVRVSDEEWAGIDAELAEPMRAMERHVFDETR